jgi:F-type H+-transporting ATPase subunit b
MHRRPGIESKLLSTALTAVFSSLMLLTIAVPRGVYAQRSQPSAPIATLAEPATAQQSGEEAKTKEAKQAEDETEAFKHSAAVRWIARLTGLSANAAYWVCVVLNFAIVVGALWVPLRKRLPGIFKSRSDSIQQRLEEARKTSEEARTRLAEVEGRLSRLDAEIAGMRREAEENARAEERRVMAEAEEERRRIVAAAEQEIASAANAARRDLKAYAGELAVDLAGKKIQVGKDQDQVLVREFTSQLGKDGH